MMKQDTNSSPVKCSNGHGLDKFFDVYVIISWCVFAFFCVYTLFHTFNNTTRGIYSQTDGEWAAWNAKFIAEFSGFLSFSPFNFFSGMGSIYLPNLPWLNPGDWPLMLSVSSRIAYAASYIVYGAELALSIVVLARMLGYSLAIGTFAAQLYIFLLFSPFNPSDWAFFQAAPVNAQIISILNFMLVLLIVCGRSTDWRKNVLCGLGVSALAFAGITTAMVTFVFSAISYCFAGLVIMFASACTRREIAWKTGAAIAAVLAFVLFGFPELYLGTGMMSARVSRGVPDLFNPDRWQNAFQNLNMCSNPLGLWCRNNPIVGLHIAGVLGAIWSIIVGTRLQRALAIWFLCFVVLLQLYAYAYFGGMLGPLHVVSVHILVFACYVFYSIYAASLWEVFLAIVGRVPKLRAELAAASIALIVFVIPLIQAQRWTKLLRLPLEHPSDVDRGLILGLLKNEAAIKLGGIFKGYTATYISDGEGTLRRLAPILKNPPRLNVLDYSVYTNSRLHLRIKTGNMHIYTDLWNFGIPTLEEYGQWISRQLFLFVQTLLAPPEAQPFPSSVHIYKLDISVLKFLGVRFLITDTPLSDPSVILRASIEQPDLLLDLYEIKDANIATYSPTHPILVRSASDFFRRVREDPGQLRRNVFVFEPIQGTFVSARDGIVTLIRGGIHLRAESDGRALLLLPIQYSHCFRVSGTENVKLHRANLIQTLVEFDRIVDVDIKMEFGLFGNSKCRIRDGKELDRILMP